MVKSPKATIPLEPTRAYIKNNMNYRINILFVFVSFLFGCDTKDLNMEDKASPLVGSWKSELIKDDYAEFYILYSFYGDNSFVVESKIPNEKDSIITRGSFAVNTEKIKLNQDGYYFNSMGKVLEKEDNSSKVYKYFFSENSLRLVDINNQIITLKKNNLQTSHQVIVQFKP